MVANVAQITLCTTYEVFYTSCRNIFMEALIGLTSLKVFYWVAWRERYWDDVELVNDMLISAARSYVGS